MTFHFHFEGKAEDPGPEWHRGYNDCVALHETWYTRKRTLRCGPGRYTDGWAEGNITVFWKWNEYWKNTLANREN